MPVSLSSCPAVHFPGGERDKANRGGRDQGETGFSLATMRR